MLISKKSRLIFELDFSLDNASMALLQTPISVIKSTFSIKIFKTYWAAGSSSIIKQLIFIIF
jgi:hypothetical protein